MLGPLLVALADEFDTSIAVAGQLAAVTFITWGITAPLVGPVSDTHGRRPVLLAGLAIMTLGVLGSAAAWSYNSLLAFRLLTGMGAAMLPPTLMATIADILPAADRGRGVGFLTGSSWVGVAIGVPVVALLGKVVIGDVLDEEGRQTEAAINEVGGECLYVHLDVTDEGSWEKAVAETVSRFGKLDILVNNAGVGGDGGRLEDTSVESWNRTMDINAKGVFLGTKTAIPEMRKAGGGSIINISSVYGLVGSGASASYHASKGPLGCSPSPPPSNTLVIGSGPTQSTLELLKLL